MKGYITYQRGMSRTGNAYTDAAIESLDGLLDAEADPNGIISTLAGDSNNSVYINEIHWTQRNGAAGGSISWSSQGGLVHEDGIGRHSPAISLLHELGHAYYQFYDPTKEIARQPNPNSLGYIESLMQYEEKERMETGDYHNYEDKWVIENVENPAAERLGQSKRSNHNNKTKYKAITPFSLVGQEKEK